MLVLCASVFRLTFDATGNSASCDDDVFRIGGFGTRRFDVYSQHRACTQVQPPRSGSSWAADWRSPSRLACIPKIRRRTVTGLSKRILMALESLIRERKSICPILRRRNGVGVGYICNVDPLGSAGLRDEAMVDHTMCALCARRPSTWPLFHKHDVLPADHGSNRSQSEVDSQVYFDV